MQSHVRTFADYLRAGSHPAEVVSPFSSRSVLLRPVFGVRYGIRPLSRSAGVWWYRRWHAHYLAQALRTRQAGSGPDTVIYAQCPVSADVALRVRTSQPVVMAAHLNISQADEWADQGEISRDGSLFGSIRAFEERVLPRLDGIVYVSEFTRGLLEERIPALAGIPGLVVANAVPPSVERPRPPTLDLVTVGALEPRKNHAYLLKVLAAAAARGHRYSLSVIGDGPDRGSLERLSRRLGLTDQVRFLGHQPDPRPLLGDHALYCHTSRMESFGIALVEAMAEGVPVLAAAVGGVPEVVRAGEDGAFWSLEDAAAAADVLIDLMEDAPRRAELAAGARASATTRFSAELLGDRLHAFLGEVRRR